MRFGALRRMERAGTRGTLDSPARREAPVVEIYLEKI